MTSTQTATQPTNHQRWSRERVIAMIRRRHSEGLALNAQAVEQDDAKLLAAARRYFGSWRKSLDASSVPYVSGRSVKHLPPGYWSQERLIAKIREYSDRGFALNAHKMQLVDNRLVSAAVYHFGSWPKALSEAGFDPELFMSRRSYTPITVITEISDIIRSGGDLRHATIRKERGALYHAAYKFFGTWKRALEMTYQVLNGHTGGAS